MFKYKQFEKGKSPRGVLKYMSLEKKNENFDPKFPTHKYAYKRKIIIIINIGTQNCTWFHVSMFIREYEINSLYSKDQL